MKNNIMTATILPNAIAVTHSSRPDVNREFLSFSVPNGWDDVKDLTDKILTYNGEQYKFSGWNSDRNECFFFKPIGKLVQYATISK
jgi:hypothetical protein